MASVFKEGKYWRARVRKKGYPSQSRTFDTKADAVLWASQTEAKTEFQSPQEFAHNLEVRHFTLRAAFERYTNEVLPSKSASSAKREQYFIKWWSNTPWSTESIAAFNSTHVAACLRILEKQGLQPNTIRLFLSNLSNLYNIARKEWGYTTLVNPVDLVRKPRLPEGRDRRLVGNEETRLLAACELKNPELADITILAIETAMRQGEIFSLTWDRVSFTQHTIKLTPELTKTRSGRTVPLSEKAEAALRRQQSRLGQSSGAVWSYRTVDGIRSSFYKALKEAGIEGLHFHDLRHEATSRFFEQGLSTAIVRGITGHKTMQMLSRYTHISSSSLVQAVRNGPQASDGGTIAQSSNAANARRFCSSCGYPLTGNDRFCGGCGVTL